MPNRADYLLGEGGIPGDGGGDEDDFASFGLIPIGFLILGAIVILVRGCNLYQSHATLLLIQPLFLPSARSTRSSSRNGISRRVMLVVFGFCLITSGVLA